MSINKQKSKRRGGENASKSVALYFAFARSGGTLVNQFLGCSKSVLVLSEVSPLKSVVPIELQMRDWHRLLRETSYAQFSSLDYLGKIDRCHDLASAAGRTLCIRDWVVVNFLAGISFDIEPSGVLENLIYLRLAGYEVRHCAIVRRSENVFQSLRRHVPPFAQLNLSVFAKGYRAYLRELEKAKCVRYRLEEIQRAPKESIRNICETLGLRAPDSIAGFHNYQWCTGNNTLPRRPPSAARRTILRQRSSPSMTHTFRELDRLAGYDD